MKSDTKQNIFSKREATVIATLDRGIIVARSEEKTGRNDGTMVVYSA